MPQGDKGKYTDKQQRQAEKIEEGYEKRGTPKKESERRAWATVNKIHGGGEKGGSGAHTPDRKSVYRAGGEKGGRAAAARSKAARSVSARKAVRSGAK